MKKIIALLTTLFFLTVPTLLLAEGAAGTPAAGKDGSVKAEKTGKKAAKSKKKAGKAAKSAKKTKQKSKKATKKDEPMVGMGTMPVHP